MDDSLGNYRLGNNQLVVKEINLTVNGLASFYLILLIIALLIGVGLEVFFILATRKGLKIKWFKVWLLWITIVGSLLLLFIISSVFAFSTSSSCISCHEMMPEYNTWARSEHKQVTCLACHSNADNGVSFAFEEFTLLREVFNHITGNYPKVINSNSELSQKRMKSQLCTRCHLPNQPTIVFGPQVKINHEAHRDEGTQCPVCHNRLAHQGARGFNYLEGTSMMSGCMRCHLPGKVRALNGKAAPTNCSTCHLQKDIAREAFGKPNPTFADFNNCEGCHKIRDPKVTQQFQASPLSKGKANLTCNSCHGVHLNKSFTPKPDSQKCNACHPSIAKQVIEKKHGKEIKSSFKKASEVRCTFCHKSHVFKAEEE